jgi:hypothetical protein
LLKISPEDAEAVRAGTPQRESTREAGRTCGRLRRGRIGRVKSKWLASNSVSERRPGVIRDGDSNEPVVVVLGLDFPLLRSPISGCGAKTFAFAGRRLGHFVSPKLSVASSSRA